MSLNSLFCADVPFNQPLTQYHYSWSDRAFLCCSCFEATTRYSKCGLLVQYNEASGGVSSSAAASGVNDDDDDGCGGCDHMLQLLVARLLRLRCSQRRRRQSHMHRKCLHRDVQRCCAWKLVSLFSWHKPKFHLARHVTSRHHSTRSACRARREERVEPCCSTSSTQLKCMGSTRRTCRIVSRRDVTSQVGFGLYCSCL